jgi:hypothetical protein
VDKEPTMPKASGATNTQKMILLALGEGWSLKFVDTRGWCLLQPNRQRPFTRVKTRTVEAMTQSGWLTEGLATQGLDFRPVKDLTTLGHKYAMRLIRTGWAEQYEFDQHHAHEASTRLPRAA